MNPIKICDCCDDSVYEIARDMRNMTTNEIESYVKKHNNNLSDRVLNGLVNVICNKPDNLNNDGRFLIKECLKFLFLQKKENPNFLRKDQSGFHKTKYIAIWSFIYDYLGIMRNNGFDYFLMAYLDTHGYMEHGSGIRCGWLEEEYDEQVSNDYFRQFLQKVNENEESALEEFNGFKEKVFEWGSNASDDL